MDACRIVPTTLSPSADNFKHVVRMPSVFPRLVFEDGIKDLHKGLRRQVRQDRAILLCGAQDLVDLQFLARSFDLLVVFGEDGDGLADLDAIPRGVWS